MSSFEIGVGIDVARYEHLVQFVGPDKQPLRKPLKIKESEAGYQRLEKAFRQLDAQWGHPTFRCVIDDANVYGRNLRHFLQSLPFCLVLTSNNPLANKRYKQVFLQDNKTDALDAYAAARFAVTEKPRPSSPIDPVVETLRLLVSHRQALAKDITRRNNRLHALLSLAFPEFVRFFPRLTTLTACRLLQQYPTARDFACAEPDQLAQFQPGPRARRLGRRKAHALVEAAKHTVGSIQTPESGALIRGLAHSLEQDLAQRERLKRLIEQTYARRKPNPLHTIPGFGHYTAAVLTAVIGDPNRFDAPEKLVGYLGLYPVDDESGQRQRRKKVMSRKGNDLARQALFMAAWAAVRSNPGVRALYARQLARGKSPMTAIGHCMRKLAVIALAILKSGEPFDPDRYERETPTPSPQHPPQPEEAPKSSTPQSPSGGADGPRSVAVEPRRPASPTKAPAFQGRVVEDADPAVRAGRKTSGQAPRRARASSRPADADGCVAGPHAVPPSEQA